MHSKLAGFKNYTLSFCIVVGYGVLMFSKLSGDAVMLLLRQTAILSFAVLGVAILQLVGCLNLSSGAQIAMTVLLAAKFRASLGLPVWLVILLSFAVAACVGFLLAFLHLQVGIPSLLLTFAMEHMLRGVASGLSAIFPALPNAQIEFRFLCYGATLGVPYWALIFVATFLAAAILLRYTYIGRCFYAVGSDSSAAQRAGLPVNKVKLTAFVLCALLVNVTALLFLSWLGMSKGPIALDTSLDVVMALCLGGVSLRGARGTVIGVALGTLAFTLVQSAFIVMNIIAINQYIVKGAILLMTIWLQQAKGVQEG